MRKLEHTFRRELVSVGVHSGKYHAERVTERIREAALRLGATHPIVNDRQFRVWRAYAVRAWPTLVVVGPEGDVLGTHAGEFTAEEVEPFLRRTLEGAEARGTLDRAPREWAADAPATAPGTLAYPGKVVVDGRRIAIADTGHRRVLVGELADAGRSARITRVIGDGALEAPQGMAFAGDTLFIADAERHAIVAADLAGGAVRTLAGTGRQLRTRADQQAGALSSPWDLALVGDTLYVAMAGNHRLYAVDVATGAARVHSGSGHEEIVDGPHAEAALAQPMGIVADGGRLYFVDAESSAVRWADADPGGAVGTLVGTGLFDFGDEDGVGDEVRMQHQQALARHPDGRLLVADSYNDALKWVDPATRRAETWVRGLHEPAGLAIGDGLVYVADTNAHRVAVVAERTGEVRELEIEGG